MHGFLNVFAAAALLAAGASAPDVEPVLLETDPAAFRFDRRGPLVAAPARARSRRWRSSRERAGASFGSCSFAEPVEGLRALGVIA